MRLHTRVQDPPRLLLVLRNVRDALDFLVPSGVEMGIKDVSILRCSIRHCLSTGKEKARKSWAEKLRGGGNFEQICFYKPKTFFFTTQVQVLQKQTAFSRQISQQKRTQIKFDLLQRAFCSLKKILQIQNLLPAMK